MKSWAILTWSLEFQFTFFKIVEEVENLFLLLGEGTAVTAKSTRLNRFCGCH